MLTTNCVRYSLAIAIACVACTSVNAQGLKLHPWDEEGVFIASGQEGEVLRFSLDDTGAFEMPSLLMSEIKNGQKSHWAYYQSPAPGERWTCADVPLARTVVIEAIAADGTILTGELDIEIVDHNPPQVDVEIPLSAGMETTVTGLPYFVSSAAFTPTVTVTDDCAVPCYKVIVNGVEATTVNVTEPGFHTLEIVAEDASGNRNGTSMVFQVRERPQASGIGIVHAQSVMPFDADYDELSVSMLVASATTSIDLLHIDSLSLQVMNDESRWVAATAAPVRDAFAVDGTYTPTNADAQYDDGYWDVSFDVLVPAGTNVGAFDLRGRVSDAGQNAVDFRSIISPAIDANAAVTLAALGLVFDDDQKAPGPRFDWGCQWESEYDPEPVDIDNQGSGFTPCGWFADVVAGPEWLYGVGLAKDDWTTCSGAHGGSALAQSGGILRVFIFPHPSLCCDQCEISVIADPTFKALATVNPPASALVAGMISVSAPCDSAKAIGVVAVGGYDPDGIDIPFVDGSVPVITTVPPAGSVFHDSLNCTIEACYADISVETGGAITVHADAVSYNWGAQAYGRLFGADADISITPRCLSGLIEGDNEPIPLTFDPWDDPELCDD